jgi:hypothetical protein
LSSGTDGAAAGSPDPDVGITSVFPEVALPVGEAPVGPVAVGAPVGAGVVGSPVTLVNRMVLVGATAVAGAEVTVTVDVTAVVGVTVGVVESEVVAFGDVVAGFVVAVGSLGPEVPASVGDAVSGVVHEVITASVTTNATGSAAAKPLRLRPPTLALLPSDPSTVHHPGRCASAVDDAGIAHGFTAGRASHRLAVVVAA